MPPDAIFMQTSLYVYTGTISMKGPGFNMDLNGQGLEISP
jgi:hypothetical protein